VSLKVIITFVLGFALAFGAGWYFIEILPIQGADAFIIQAAHRCLVSWASSSVRAVSQRDLAFSADWRSAAQIFADPVIIPASNSQTAE
jgi:hypothetical protein